MNTDFTNATFKPGSIRKILVKDFVTYRSAVMTPGPNLNMLIGPNGTGKSTVVAAIILGLGGNPKTVGRGTKISEYIKHDCSTAVIEIILQGHNPNERISITRHFDNSEKSIWTLNGKKVPTKEIEHVTKQFNIQVDNLCQFLPQDRVQEFAKMNKQQLLEQTQIAICKSDLMDKQQKLIQFRNRHKDLLTLMEKYDTKLQELRDANLRIEGKIKNLKKKKKYLRTIEDIERKVAWVNFDVLKTKVDAVKEDKLKAADILKTHRAKAEPIERCLGNINGIINKLKATIATSNKEIRSNESKVQNMIETNRKLKLSIANALNDLDSRLRNLNRRDQEITELREQLRGFVENKSKILESYGNETDREKKLQTYNAAIQNINVEANKITEKKRSLVSSKRNVAYELQSLENKVTQLENIKKQRLEWLRRMDKDVYSAVQWLRSNKHMFKGEVYEPMVLELNVLNHQHAIYIENSIGMRDRVAFTCTLKEDMNLLIELLNTKQKLSVNILYSGNDQPALHTYQPIIPIERLKKYGMFAYIRSLVTGPEPIMKFLCKMYNIHNIPVGNSNTAKYFEEIPPQIKKFFSHKHSFIINVSKYTGSKSIRQVEIRSDGSLSIYVDAEQLANVRAQVVEFRSQNSKYDEQIKNLDAEVENLNEKQSNIRNSIRELKKWQQDIASIDSRIRITNNSLRQLEVDSTTKEQIQEECNTRIRSFVNDMVKCQIEIEKLFKSHSNILIESEVNETRLAATNKQKVILQNKSVEIRELCQQAERTLDNINVTLSNIKNEARTALSKAKKVSNNCTPVDDGFAQFREAYENLSNNLEELEAEKEHILSKIDCLSTANMNELRDYEERINQIDKFQNEKKENAEELDHISSSMEVLHNEWLQPLQVLIDQINTKFSDAFRRLGCAGEVTISTGDNDKDYNQYGISIKVKYRDTEPLQELDNVTQSGGERAVATAAYMLSLQELTPVPFRCVDEINQGMDPNNERRTFEILVDATNQPDTSQYFFITPKLVSNLKFVHSMTIHFVHNGPFCSIPEQNHLE